MTDDTPTRREELERLRATLLAAIAGAGARDLAPLARELRQVLSELEMTVAPSEPTRADQIAARRKARRTGRVDGDSQNPGRAYN